MRLSAFILFFLYATLSSLSAEYREDAFLFCLTPDQAPLIISREAGEFHSGIDELDYFLNSNPIIEIEPWLTHTTPNEHSGDIYLSRIYRIYLTEPKAHTRDLLRDELSSFPFIHSAEKEPIHKPVYTPNDPQYSQQWFLPQIQADDAWNFWDVDGGELPGDRDVILASVDTGVDFDHEDLVDNIWNNLGEDANGNGVTLLYEDGSWIYDPGDINGQDEDGNGYVDDLIGWDCAGYSGLQDNIPSPPSGVSNGGTWAHGTHVAGLLSATSNNNTGIASIGFNCSIMSVKVSTGEQSYPYITHGYDGILYAARAGYHNDNFTIINNSWGGIGYNQYEQSVIDVVHDDYGAVVVAAAGNGDEWELGTDDFAHYPSSYEHVISVCAMGGGDNWNHWATYHESVDLSSPGEGIRSTKINNGYTSWSGSSMASPIAAGTIGLLRSFNMDWTNEMLETMILATADPVIYDINTEDYLQGKLGTGRVDALRSLSTDLFPRFELIGSDFFLPNDASGIVSAGDALEVMVILLNDEGWGTAVNITGLLSADSDEISIQNPTMNFDDAFPGMPIVNDSSPYEVELSPTILPGEYEFILTLTANEVDGIGYEADFGFILLVEEDNQLFLGDVNGDNTVNILDIVMVANYTLGQAEFSDEQIQAADVNGDGVINILDIVQIINIVLDS
jgi:hypothetical protein